MLVGFQPGVMREIKKINQEAFKKLDNQYNSPELRGLRSMHKLMLAIDHRNKIHTKESNEAAFCLPSRVRELRAMDEQEPTFEELFENVPEVIKNIYKAFADVPGETQRYKFTKVVMKMYQFATVAQAAKMAVNQVEYERKNDKDRKYTQQEANDFWNQQQVAADIIGKFCPRDQNHILKATRTQDKYLKKQFQDHLEELKGQSGDYISEFYTSPAEEPAKAKAPPPGAPSSMASSSSS